MIARYRLPVIVSVDEVIEKAVPPSPVRVRRVDFVMSAVCPVSLEQPTFPAPVGTSHLCQQRKLAAPEL